MYDQPLYNAIKAECGKFSDIETDEPRCASLLRQMNEKIGEFDVYNVYDTCGRDRGDKDPQQSKAGTVFGLEELMATDTV